MGNGEAAQAEPAERAPGPAGAAPRLRLAFDRGVVALEPDAAGAALVARVLPALEPAKASAQRGDAPGAAGAGAPRRHPGPAAGHLRDMRPRRLLPRQRATIPSSFLVRALATRGRRHHCVNCGEVMFVRYASGLCPLCFNGRRTVALAEPTVEVPPERALAGVLDDPAIEDPHR